jgi:type IV pilus assembly protein PilV
MTGDESAPRGRRQERGFTLLEVMVAMLLLAIGMSALGVAQVHSLRQASSGKQMSQAMYLAEAQMELFHAMPDTAAVFLAPANVNDPTNPIQVSTGPDDMTRFNRRWSIQPNTPAIGLTTVTVQVDWVNPLAAPGTGPRTVTLQSIKRPDDA